jgi:hypothetical protein
LLLAFWSILWKKEERVYLESKLIIDALLCFVDRFLEADAASVISCREGKPDFVKPYSTCVAQIVEIYEASSQMSQIWSCISASLFCHSHSAAQHNVTSCNHHTNRIPCLDSLELYGWVAIILQLAATTSRSSASFAVVVSPETSKLLLSACQGHHRLILLQAQE